MSPCQKLCVFDSQCKYFSRSNKGGSIFTTHLYIYALVNDLLEYLLTFTRTDTCMHAQAHSAALAYAAYNAQVRAHTHYTFWPNAKFNNLRNEYA